ncbi:MAG: dUTP diphosphatase [[Eubacterium] brachy]|mgnify:FL=1|jgi:dUTP diphosphatase|nr:putative dUTP diphosphatase [Eubacterium brachy ATCC 33089]MBF1133783.1 dUTP diphosphatase [[Eubacterium] brachy]
MTENNKVKVKIVTKTGDVPKYETAGSAGMDLKADLKTSVTLNPMERQLIPTGLFIELPIGYEAQVRARSGLSIKYGITLINAIGTVDSDYRGELKVPLVNLGNEPFVIKHGERIAQLVVTKHDIVQWEIVERLEDTDRGSGGFGHTGK